MRDIFNCTDIAEYFNPTAFAEPERFLMYVCFEALVSCVATSFSLDEVVDAESCLHLPGVDSERLAMSEVVDEMFVRSEEMVGRTGKQVLCLVQVRHVRVGLTG